MDLVKTFLQHQVLHEGVPSSSSGAAVLKRAEGGSAKEASYYSGFASAALLVEATGALDTDQQAGFCLSMDELLSHTCVRS